MPASHPSYPRTITTNQRRQSILGAYANGALWGVASGLVSVTLVTYLAREYGATGVAVSWLLAAPALAGLLRLLTPFWLERVGSRQTFCIRMFLASALVLFALPIVTAPQVLPTSALSIAALATMWAGYHVLEYLGAVALWSWFGDLVPRRVRGRFIGRRQAWANAGKVVGTVLAAVGTYLWMNYCDAIARPDWKWRAYAACGLAGAVTFALSTWPLQGMTDLPLHATDRPQPDTLGHQLLSPLLSPWTNVKFRRLLCFGLWFSFSNGIAQSARWMFFTSVLHLSFVEKKVLDAGSRGVQSLLMPSVGDWVDRRGNVSVLAFSQGIIALAPLFFLIATPETRWWIGGAYACWLAYAGENVALPNLMLGLSPPDQTAAHAAAWFTWTQLAYALSVLLGGLLFDWLAEHFTPQNFAGLRIDHFAILFIASWLLKSIGVYWAARIRESTNCHQKNDEEPRRTISLTPQCQKNPGSTDPNGE